MPGTVLSYWPEKIVPRRVEQQRETRWQIPLRAVTGQALQTMRQACSLGARRSPEIPGRFGFQGRLSLASLSLQSSRDLGLSEFCALHPTQYRSIPGGGRTGTQSSFPHPAQVAR